MDTCPRLSFSRERAAHPHLLGIARDECCAPYSTTLLGVESKAPRTPCPPQRGYGQGTVACPSKGARMAIFQAGTLGIAAICSHAPAAQHKVIWPKSCYHSFSTLIHGPTISVVSVNLALCHTAGLPVSGGNEFPAGLVTQNTQTASSLIAGRSCHEGEGLPTIRGNFSLKVSRFVRVLR